MKKYNVPATEVVAFAGSTIMQAASSPTNVPNPNEQNIDPGQG